MKNNIENLKRGLGLHISKSYVEGIYSDNATNRKLGRVGMSYGTTSKEYVEGFEDEEDTGETYVINPRLVLKRAKSLLGERSFKLLKDIIETPGYKVGDIYEYKGKIYFNSTLEVSPEENSDIVHLGKRVESQTPTKEGDLYSFIRRTYSPEAMEGQWFNTFEKEESWGTAKNYSILSRLHIANTQRQRLLDDAKHDIWWSKYDKGEVDFNSDPREISDYEAEKYIKIHGSKMNKDIFKESSKNFTLINALIKDGIDFDGTDLDDIDKFNRDFKFFIKNCPRNEYYQVVKGCAEDSIMFEELLRLRFGFKYNKMLVGAGWNDIRDQVNSKNGNYYEFRVNVGRRDEVLELCKQIEYSIDDVLAEDKDLFIRNPNIDFIRYDKDTDWGGASYNKYDKTITITSEYFKEMRKSRAENSNSSTLSREKFLVEGFIHEIGHSLDVTKDVYNSSAYRDFCKHLGYEQNRLYTIYANAIRQDKDAFVGQDYYLSIEKDKKQDLIDKFKPLYDAYFGRVKEFSDSDLSDIFISKYSSKSASEGFAEYFSFYMGNKKFLDKEIKKYNENPTEYLKNANIKSWYKYSVYGGKWEQWFDAIPERYKDSEGTKLLKKYYQSVIEHNIEMFEDIQKVVQNVERKFGVVKVYKIKR